MLCNYFCERRLRKPVTQANRKQVVSAAEKQTIATNKHQIVPVQYLKVTILFNNMRYIDIGGEVTPKHCIYGPRPAEGIVFSNYEWWSITDHLVREQREREMAAVCKAKEDAKKNLSFGMTSTWNNTLASIKTQGNQKRLEKMEKEKQDKIDQYHQILKARKEEKREILENVKKILFNDKDPVKTINSAVGYSTVLGGRKRQLELKDRIKRAKAKEEEEWVMKIKKDEQDYEREKYQEKLNEKAKLNIWKQQIEAQLKELRDRKQEEAEEFQRQKQDFVNMAIEGERIHRCNMAEKEYRKNFAARYIKKTENQLEYERNIALEEEEENEIIRIYKEYDRKFKKERKEREARMKDEEVQRRIKISEMLAQKMGADAQKEEDIYQAAVKEKEEEARRVEEEKKEKERRALEDLLEGKRKAEEARKRKLHEEKEKLKWEMMQLYRSAEVNEEWKRMQEKRKLELRNQLVTALACQCKQLEEKRAKELKEFLTPLEDEAQDREDLLRYCEVAMKYVRENNLPDVPVLRAIADVKQLYGIEDKERLELLEKKKQREAEQRDCKKARPSLEKGCYCLKY